MTRTAIITVGISASGKTTWARQYAQETGAIITNRDDLRFSLTGAKDWGEYKFNRKIEDIVTQIQRTTVCAAYDAGKDVICADTNLNAQKRGELINYLEDIGYRVSLRTFDITFEEALRRDSLRANGVGKDVLYRQWKDWLVFSGRRVYEPCEGAPKAVIFDVDGTLAHMTGRKPYAWAEVGSDAVDPHLARILEAYIHAGYAVLVVSGRDGVCKPETAKWLYDNDLEYDALFMREEGDMRKDTVVKEEIFWNQIAHRYNVEVVFDDRPSVVRMWQDIGIPKVIAVADQNKEF